MIELRAKMVGFERKERLAELETRRLQALADAKEQLATMRRPCRELARKGSHNTMHVGIGIVEPASS